MGARQSHVLFMKTDTAPITLQLDGQPRQLPAGTTLAALLEQLGHAPEAVGTAVNGDFVPRGARAARVLGEGDAVLLFQPIVGG
jgi:sulfur carrier protein